MSDNGMKPDRDGKPQQDAAFTKETGLRHLLAATRYSFQGMQRLWQEAAFRHEVLAFAAGLVLFAIASATAFEFIVFAVLMLLLFAVEALNTAIEELVDRVSPEISTVGRHAKDLGSFAVFCLIAANSIYAAYVVIFSHFI